MDTFDKGHSHDEVIIAYGPAHCHLTRDLIGEC